MDVPKKISNPFKERLWLLYKQGRLSFGQVLILARGHFQSDQPSPDLKDKQPLREAH